jgi:aspartyl-tRNA(Asn)/glutamyl-tRNA(Gln) amidotransferase subunit A
VPAALCGVVGFKPTFGRVSLEGVVPLSWSLDHVGILSRAVDDVEIIAACLGIVDGKTTSDFPDRPLRVGIVPGWREECEPAVKRGFDAAKRALAQSGATFTEIALPDQAEARTVSLTVQLAEALTYHGPNLRRAGNLFGADIRNGLVLGQFLSAESYIQCKRLMTCYRQAFEICYETMDVLLTPACPITAPTIGTETNTIGQDRMPIGNALTLFTSFFNLVGAPAIVIPTGADERGLPVGVQLVGRPEDDARLLSAALLLERALTSTDGDQRTPKL